MPFPDRLLPQDEKQLKNSVMQKLVESGWKDRVKEHCFSVLASKRGRLLSVEQLITDVTPYARNILPVGVKSDLLESVRARDSQNYRLLHF